MYINPPEIYLRVLPTSGPLLLVSATGVADALVGRAVGVGDGEAHPARMMVNIMPAASLVQQNFFIAVSNLLAGRDFYIGGHAPTQTVRLFIESNRHLENNIAAERG